MHAIINFTGDHSFGSDHVATFSEGAGKSNRIKECNTARLVQVHTSKNDGGGCLYHLKLIIKIELR